MGGTSTYGIEQPNGSVLYNVYRENVFLDSILYEFRKGRSMELYDHSRIASSIEDYYNEERFKDEDSVVRGLLQTNGILEWRYVGEKGSFAFTMIK
jgi:hypothetical protein